MENKEIYIHIGYPKTATTTLQKHIFANLNDFLLIGQPITFENPELQKLIHTITDCETLEYNKDKVKKNIIDLIDGKDRLLISEESFSTGSSLSGRVDRAQIANRLNDIFPNAKIIVVLREQRSIIKSYYLQKKKIDFNFNKSFCSWFNENMQNLHKENLFQYFHYDVLLNYYEKLFARDNTYVFLYEDFLYNKQMFFERLLKLLKIDDDANEYLKILENAHENRTLTYTSIYLKMISSKLGMLISIFPANLKRLVKDMAARGDKYEVELNKDQKEFIEYMYTNSNRVVNKKYNLNMERYDYFV